MSESLAHGAISAPQPSSPPPARRVLGRGRSGIVYLELPPHAPAEAVKVFLGDPAGDLVNTVLSGAPAAYAWCEAAVRCAAHRRNVLAALVDAWFGDRLRVAPGLGVRWEASARAWALRSEYVDGRPAALHHPFSADTDDEQRELRDEVMRPLQRRLLEAGLVGMAWQAGLGNPVAADNFLRDRSGGTRWVWIDLESGVPALFPLDPRPLLRTYLPCSWRFRRPLFDDTDCHRLRAYLHGRRADLTARLGGERWQGLLQEAERLESTQTEWKSIGRTEGGVLAALSSGRIDDEAAARYMARPALWLRDEGRRLLSRVRRAVGDRAAAALRACRHWRPAPALRAVARFVVSQRTRERVARRFVLERIRYWRRRRQLPAREAAYLRRQARHQEQAAYLTDFVAHLAIKPAYKAVVWGVLPVAAQLGWVPFWVVGVGLVAGGSIARTLYTAGRGIQALFRRQRFPWMALVVGLAPVVGSAAYPAQLVASSRGREGKLAALMLYDTVTGVGRGIPIWGGRDSMLEHAFNRLPDRIVPRREPLLSPRVGTGG